jgi:hypothetical protein
MKAAPANTKSAAVLLAQAAAELAEITKEKGPALAENAVNAARDRLGKLLPFAARSTTAPVAAAAE